MTDELVNGPQMPAPASLPAMDQGPFPDIEIYLKRPNLPALLAWLEAAIGPVEASTQGDTSTVTLGAGGPEPLTCIIVSNAVKGGYTSVWFKTNQTPWATDRDCALAAWAALQIEVRCSNGGWDGLDEQGWRRFTHDGETVVNWFV